MMISPESYIYDIKEKSYKELLTEREVLLNDIKKFEKYDDERKYNIEIHPSPEVRYKCNLLYLAKLCELIAEKFDSNN